MLRHRALWLLVLSASVLVSLFAARRVRIGFQYRDFYAYPGNPELAVFDRYSDYFGDPGGHIAVLVQAPDIFQPAVLRYVTEVSRALQGAHAFSHVKSLSTVRLLRAQGDDVASGPVMEHVPRTPEELAALRRLVTDSRLTLRRLVSSDGKTTAVLADMRQIATTATIREQRAAIGAVRAVLAAHPAPLGVRTRLTGQPVVEVETTDTLLRDLVVLTPITLLALTVALWVMFRAAQPVFIVLTTVSVSVSWTVGVFALIGRPVDIIGSVIPTVLLVYGAVDPIFVFTRYRSKVSEGLSPEAAILKTMSELAQPCFLTSLTTALGFAAFITGILPTVRYFGLVLAIGVMLAFVTTVTVLPLLVSLGPAFAGRLALGQWSPRRRARRGWAGDCGRGVCWQTADHQQRVRRLVASRRGARNDSRLGATAQRCGANGGFFRGPFGFDEAPRGIARNSGGYGRREARRTDRLERLACGPGSGGEPSLHGRGPRGTTRADFLRVDRPIFGLARPERSGGFRQR